MSDANVKEIDPAALASLTTGVLLVDFSHVHEAAEWLMGHPVWTHEFPTLWPALNAAALAQFDDLPGHIEGTTWEATRDAVRVRYGATVQVQQGEAVRTADPIATLTVALANAPRGEA